MPLSWKARLFLAIASLVNHAVAGRLPHSIPGGVTPLPGGDVNRHDLNASPVDIERRGRRGAFFLLVNATPWTFTQVNQHQYQMTAWEFPQVISPGTSTRIYMEARGHADDGAECSYSINDVNPDRAPVFEIRYHDGIRVNFSSLETLNNVAGSMLELEWRDDNNIPFIVASSELNPSSPVIQPMIVSSNPPEDWMHASYDRISCLSLRELCMPGTHDSGMSVFEHGSGVAIPVNTKTQELSIRDQLRFGARWFDIRPVISGGDWTTGHYSFGAGAWQGGNGEYIAPMIDRINEFTASNEELIILKLSHGLNTDTFYGDKHNHLSQVEWDQLMTLMKSLNNRVRNLGATQDLSKLLVSDLIANGAAVIIVVDDVVDEYGTPVDVSAYADEGFFRPDQLPMFDEYADQNNQDKMINDQLGKLTLQRPSRGSNMFLLSWTLTQLALSIIANGKAVNRALVEKLWPVLTMDTYPNVISVDAYPSNRDIAALSMAINYNFARLC